MVEKLICFSIDMLMVISFGIMGAMFKNSKGKGCNYIAGYNMKNQDERKKYDEERICRYYGKTIMSWAIYFIIGAIVDFFIPGFGITFAFILWIIAFSFHMFHMRDKKFDENFKD